MTKRPTLEIVLSSELETFVTARIASGRYPSATAVVEAGLRLLEAQEETEASALAEVRRKIASGLEQARRGELRDGEAIFDELDRQEDEWHAEAERGDSS